MSLRLATRGGVLPRAPRAPSRRSYGARPGLNEVVIVAAARTPVGSFNGALKSLSAPALGSVAIRAALGKINLRPEAVQEVYMGNVVSAGLGQAPARQAALGAGLPDATEATTINKVCASGLKALILATQALQTGARDCMVAGGMESMSNVPFYVKRGVEFGHQTLADGIIKDGLWDVYNNIHMGNCAEETAVEYTISREAQDEHAVTSYKRAAAAWKAGLFKDEIAPVTIKGRKGETIVSEDEEFKAVNFDKIPTLKPVFQKTNGTITAANASTINDGASAMVLMTRKKADALGLKPLASILAYADAATSPKKFAIAPSLAIPLALQAAGLVQADVSLWEINEAFSVVVRANEQILGLDPTRVNIAGGGVSLGHPIGSSGSRIVVSLVHLLKQDQVGVAAICNGGGAASSLVIRKE